MSCHRTSFFVFLIMQFSDLILSDSKVTLRPLVQSDFESLFLVAADPLIWEQHPNPDRFKREVFMNYFEGAIDSKGAFLICETSSGDIIGCSRFYDFLPENSEIKIGYTFFARSVWGKGYNPAAKKLMLEHAFTFVKRVVFHVGAQNIRSQIAMERLGAVKIGEEPVAYYGEATKMNVVYVIDANRFSKPTES